MPSKPPKKKEIVEGSTANEEDKLEECDDNNNTPFIQFLLQKIHTNRPSPYKLLGRENEDTFENEYDSDRDILFFDNSDSGNELTRAT